jgi:hypothetical protein
MHRRRIEAAAKIENGESVAAKSGMAKAGEACGMAAENGSENRYNGVAAMAQWRKSMASAAKWRRKWQSVNIGEWRGGNQYQWKRKMAWRVASAEISKEKYEKRKWRKQASWRICINGKIK